MIEFLYEDPAFKYHCLKFTGNEVDAEDLLQDVAERLWKSPVMERPLKEIKSFAYVVIRNRYFDLHRNKKVHRIDYKEVEVGAPQTIEKKIEIAAELVRVNEKMKLLPLPTRKALLLHANGVHYKEVAKVVRIPVNTLLTNVMEAKNFITGKRDKPRLVRPRRDATPVKWTKEEDEILRNFSYLEAHRITELYLNRTVNAIYIRAKKLGIKLRKNVWSTEDDLILVSLYKTHTAKELKQKIPGKTVKAIKDRIQQHLKLRKNPMVKWTEQEKRELNRLYRKLHWQTLEKKFGRSYGACQQMYFRMNKDKPYIKLLKRTNKRKK